MHEREDFSSHFVCLSVTVGFPRWLTFNLQMRHQFKADDDLSPFNLPLFWTSALFSSNPSIKFVVQALAIRAMPSNFTWQNASIFFWPHSLVTCPVFEAWFLDDCSLRGTSKALWIVEQAKTKYFACWSLPYSSLLKGTDTGKQLMFFSTSDAVSTWIMERQCLHTLHQKIANMALPSMALWWFCFW